MNYIKQFFSYDYQFYINTVRLGLGDQVYGALSIAFIVLAIVFKVRARLAKNAVSKKLSERWFYLFATIGFLGVVWYGLRYQYAQVLGTHFAFHLILLAGLVWAYYILKYWWKQYTSEKEAWEKEQLKLKYLRQ